FEHRVTYRRLRSFGPLLVPTPRVGHPWQVDARRGGRGEGRTRTSVCVRTTAPAPSDMAVTEGHIARLVAWGRADQGPARRSPGLLRGGRARCRGGRARARE